MAARKIKNYIANWYNALVPAANFINPGIQVLNERRGFYLRGILFDIAFYNNTTGARVALAVNNLLSTELTAIQVGTGAESVGKSCNSIALPAPAAIPYLQFNMPGQYDFHGIYFHQDINININIVNNDAVNAYRCMINLIIEIEET